MKKLAIKTHFTRKNLIFLGLMFFYCLCALIGAVGCDASGMMKEGNPIQAIGTGFGFPLINGSIQSYILIVLFLIYVLFFTAAFIYEMRLAKYYENKIWSKKWAIIYGSTFLISLALWLTISLIAQYPYNAETIGNSFLFLIESLFVGFVIYVLLASIIAAIIVLYVNFKNIDKPFKFFSNKADLAMEEDYLEEEQEKLEAQDNLADVLVSMDDGYSILATVSETITYPSELGVPAVTTTSQFKRDYGYIDSGSERKAAVRDYSGDDSVIYFEGEEGLLSQEILMPDNTVDVISLDSLGMPVLFSDIYRNPFDYIDEDDIDSTLALNPTKASFLLETYLGIDRAVSEATLILQDNKLSSIDLVLPRKQMGIEINNEILNFYSEMEVTIDFSYDFESLTHLSPIATSDPDLEAAFNNMGSSYTVILSSQSDTTSHAYYVYGDYIYYQDTYGTVGPSDEDDIYVYNNGIYYCYTYSNGQLVQAATPITDQNPLNAISNLTSISSNIYEKVSSNTYAMLELATSYGATYLVPTIYNEYITEGSGLASYITLEDGHIETIATIIASGGSPLTIKADFIDYGTTSIPSWVNVDRI